MKIAQVFVEHPIMHLDHTFTYACDGFLYSAVSVYRCRLVRPPSSALL